MELFTNLAPVITRTRSYKLSFHTTPPAILANISAPNQPTAERRSLDGVDTSSSPSLLPAIREETSAEPIVPSAAIKLSPPHLTMNTDRTANRELATDQPSQAPDLTRQTGEGGASGGGGGGGAGESITHSLRSGLVYQTKLS